MILRSTATVSSVFSSSEASEGAGSSPSAMASSAPSGSDVSSSVGTTVDSTDCSGASLSSAANATLGIRLSTIITQRTNDNNRLTCVFSIFLLLCMFFPLANAHISIYNMYDHSAPSNNLTYKHRKALLMRIKYFFIWLIIVLRFCCGLISANPSGWLINA